MIVLDTNVLSAVMQAEPPDVVIAWLDRQPTRSLWTTAVTVFEVEYGLQRIPDGRRRKTLETAFRATIAEELGGRILSLDAHAALAAGAIAAALAAEGRTPDFRGALIAGITRARGAVLATRNVKHFAGVCQLVNPWEDG
ncbi:MAG: PIN domain-containing protein [Planctomycetaceae bacterium]|nr:PIN domain-containing protein [Planctomycetaceae bacterium]